MSIHELGQAFLGSSLICVVLLVSTAGYAQENQTDVDKRLQQLEKLEKSGLYSEDEIAKAKTDLLQSIVNPARYSGGEYDYIRIGSPGASARATDNELYQAYRERLKNRRERALVMRQYVFARPPARGWLAISVPWDISSTTLPLDRGVLSQSPIQGPRRRVLVVPSYDDYPYGNNSYGYYPYGDYSYGYYPNDGN